MKKRGVLVPHRAAKCKAILGKTAAVRHLAFASACPIG
jgi:hypothetical protein